MVSVEMPAFSKVAKASPAEPFLAVVIQFDLAVMRDVMACLDKPPMPEDPLGRRVFVTDFDGPLADCVLRDQFAETVRIEDLAAVAQMSPSAFHRQFKALTSMTPLQYQKQMRLLEARHLMVAGAANAEAAPYRVGYESPSQFSREYARMFGAPPRRDIAALKTAVT